MARVEREELKNKDNRKEREEEPSKDKREALEEMKREEEVESKIQEANKKARELEGR